jgi:hypothetical protein
MPTDPNIPEDPAQLDPTEEKMRRTTGKEWMFVYVLVIVIIVIAALTAYHLTHG